MVKEGVGIYVQCDLPLATMSCGLFLYIITQENNVSPKLHLNLQPCVLILSPLVWDREC